MLPADPQSLRECLPPGRPLVSDGENVTLNK